MEPAYCTALGIECLELAHRELNKHLKRGFVRYITIPNKSTLEVGVKAN